MNRFRKRRFLTGLPPARTVGLLALMAFALFVSFRIFNAPTETLQIAASPDGRREARLQHVFYYSEPGYKVAVRSGFLWKTLLYIPEITDAADAEASIRWSSDSRRLWLDINQKPVWKHDVQTD